jgi:glucosyl-3-phosphoglycerate synthase
MLCSATRQRAAPPNERDKPRAFHHSRFPAAEIAHTRRGQNVSVCLPARECAATVGQIVTTLQHLRGEGVLDEIVVVDAGSADGTATVAERAGATVWQEGELMPAFGPVLGKGDAMWRALPFLRGELVCFLDADTERFPAHFATGLLGALVCEPRVEFVKGFYRRPLSRGGLSLPDAGGRVNHLTARPALELLYPELAAVRQPLAGEVAARRALLEEVPFSTGYGVEIAMLIDVWRRVGVQGIAQVDLDEHHNRSQPLPALHAMAVTVLATVLAHAQRDGRCGGAQPVARNGAAASPALAGPGPRIRAPLERPALRSLRVDRSLARLHAPGRV